MCYSWNKNKPRIQNTLLYPGQILIHGTTRFQRETPALNLSQGLCHNGACRPTLLPKRFLARKLRDDEYTTEAHRLTPTAGSLKSPARCLFSHQRFSKYSTCFLVYPSCCFLSRQEKNFVKPAPYSVPEAAGHCLQSPPRRGKTDGWLPPLPV